MRIYCSLSGEQIEKIINDFKGKNFSFLKELISNLIVEKICPIGDEIKKLLNDKSHLINVLKQGTDKANSIASSKLKKIHEKIGLLS